MTTLTRRRLLGISGIAAASGLLGIPQAFADPRKLRGGTRAIVIGSGLGGSIAALRLGQAGVKTVVLERGQHYSYSPTQQVFGNESTPRSDMFWFQSVATWPTVPPVPIEPVPGILEVNQQDGITIACGAAVGGGSLVYTGCTVQPPRQYFEAVWPSGISYSELDQIYYPLVRGMLSATPIPPDVYRSDPFTHSRVFDKAMAAAGYPATPVPSDFNWLKVRGELARKLRPSAIIGESTFGNSDGAKNDMTQTYLPRALATGNVSISALTEVTSITTRPGGGFTVEAVLYAPDGTLAGTSQLSSDLLFMSAGSVGTTKLLVAARDTGTLPNLNEYVGTGWGSNGDAFALRTFSGAEGVTQAAPCASTAFVANKFGKSPVPIRVENWYALAFDGTGNMAQFSVAVDLENRGTWTYDGTTKTVKLSDWSASKNVPSESTAQAFNQMIIDKGLASSSPFPVPTGLTAHPLGGCVVGKATDLYGRVDGHKGLFAVDGSIVPGNTGGANPSLTIAAMAERSMAEIVLRNG